MTEDSATSRRERLRRLTRIGLLGAAAVGLHVLEAPLPRILPWAKPGLANSMTLVALLSGGLGEALAVVGIRILLAGLLLGTLATPTWLLGSAGALVAALVMAPLLRAAPPLGMISVSVAGAVASNVAQLAGASWFLAAHEGLLASLPLMVVTAVPGGVAVAMLAHLAISRLPAGGERAGAAPRPQGDAGSPLEA